METQEFLEQIEAEKMRPIEVPTGQLTGTAYGIKVQRLPHKDALLALKHLLLPEGVTHPNERPFVFMVVDNPAQIIGRIHLTLEVYAKIERILMMYQVEVHELSQDGVWLGEVPKASLVHTLQLQGKSIFSHI